MSLRLEFVTLAQKENANIAELCRRFEISRKNGYKWLQRFREGGKAALEDRSRKPKTSPERTPEVVRSAVLALREKHPAWGPRKLRRRLEDMGVKGLPAPSAIHRLLHREGCIN